MASSKNITIDPQINFGFANMGLLEKRKSIEAALGVPFTVGTAKKVMNIVDRCAPKKIRGVRYYSWMMDVIATECLHILHWPKSHPVAKKAQTKLRKIIKAANK